MKKLVITVVSVIAATIGMLSKVDVASAAVPSEVTNWGAGYVMTGGIYNEVSATFTVPNLNSGAPARSGMYVYIFMTTGWNCKGGCGFAGDQYVEVGIIESMQSCNGMSEPYDPNTYYDCSFAANGSSSLSPPIIPKEGDALTVEIAKEGSSYSLQMFDKTAAGNCSGYGCAAWGGKLQIRGAIHAIGWLVQTMSPMPGFGPAIRFSDCKFGPSTASGVLSGVTMRIAGQNVVTASAISSRTSGFTLTYEG